MSATQWRRSQTPRWYGTGDGSYAGTSDSTSELRGYCATTMAYSPRTFVMSFLPTSSLLAFRRRGGGTGTVAINSSTRPARIRPSPSIVIALRVRMVKGALRDAASLRFSLGLRPPLEHPGAVPDRVMPRRKLKRARPAVWDSWATVGTGAEFGAERSIRCRRLPNLSQLCPNNWVPVRPA
jgi:hypothetical protein